MNLFKDESTWRRSEINGILNNSSTLNGNKCCSVSAIDLLKDALEKLELPADEAGNENVMDCY